MVAAGVDASARKRGLPCDDESIRQLADCPAERFDERGGRPEPIRLLDAQPRGILNPRFPRAERGQHAHDRHQIRDRPRVERDAAQRAAPALEKD